MTFWTIFWLSLGVVQTAIMAYWVAVPAPWGPTMIAVCALSIPVLFLHAYAEYQPPYVPGEVITINANDAGVTFTGAYFSGPSR